MSNYFQNINNNLPSIFLFLIAFTFPLGIYFFPIQTPILVINGFHVALYSALAYLIINKKVKIFLGKSGRYYLILLFIWLTYGFCGLLWAKELKPVLQDMFGLINAISIILVLQSLLVLNKFRVVPFIQGWFAAFAVASCIGIIEAKTAIHLDAEWNGFPIRNTPLTTFDNPNNYAVFLVFTLPLLLMFKNHITAATFKVFFLLGLLWLILLTQSRLGIFSFFLLLGIGFFSLRQIDHVYFKKKIQHYSKFYLPIIAFTLILIFFSNFQFVENIYAYYFHPSTTISSDGVRVKLVLAGLEMFVNSYGMGVGGGNYPYYINHHLITTNTHGYCNPHNWVIEVLSQYGLVIFILLAVFGFYLIQQYLKLMKQFKNEGVNKFTVCGILLGIAYLIMSIDPSSFMRMPMNWIALSIIVIITDCLHTNATEFYDQNNMSSNLGSSLG